MGAALQANSLIKKNPDSFLLDVTPLSLGIETMGGNVERIIHRNTTIPFSSSQIFTTQKANQTSISFNIVQGEQKMAFNCKSLARFELNGLPKKPAGACQIIVSFSIDNNGLLHVEAMDKVSNNFYEVDIKPSYDINEEEILRLMAEINYYTSKDLNSYLTVLSQMKVNNFCIESSSSKFNNNNTPSMENISIKLGLLKMIVKYKNRTLIEKLITSIRKTKKM